MRSVLRSALGAKINSYLEFKKALGRRFANETRVLTHFDGYLAKRRPSKLSPDSFAGWSLTLTHLTPTVRRNRMRIVRNFCLYLRRGERRCFIPDASGFPEPHQPRRPHIFSEEQITRLLDVASSLPSSSTSLLRAAVYRVAVVLLYTAGLRRGEVVRLVMSDYDAGERTLLVRASKFHKSRLVALSKSAADELDRYLRQRRRLRHSPEAPLLVSNHRGLRAYNGGSFGFAMRGLFRMADVRMPNGRLPRVHDLRHTFAVHALLRWYRDGADVQAKLPALAIAMGHVSIASTAYYLALLDPVMHAASRRFFRHCRGILASLRGAQ
jgi:integrase/recombinase XerD